MTIWGQKQRARGPHAQTTCLGTRRTVSNCTDGRPLAVTDKSVCWLVVSSLLLCLFQYNVTTGDSCSGGWFTVESTACTLGLGWVDLSVFMIGLMLDRLDCLLPIPTRAKMDRWSKMVVQRGKKGWGKRKDKNAQVTFSCIMYTEWVSWGVNVCFISEYKKESFAAVDATFWCMVLTVSLAVPRTTYYIYTLR